MAVVSCHVLTPYKLEVSQSTLLSHIGGDEVHLHSFLTCGLDGGGQAHAPAAVTWGKEPLYLLGARAGLESDHPSGIRTPDRSAHNLASISVGYTSTKQLFTAFVGPYGKIPGQHPDLATTDSFRILSNSFFVFRKSLRKAIINGMK
jgi:hypothetical protein